MSGFATWPIFVGFFCGVALYLVLRNSPLRRTLDTAKPATEVTIKIKEDALREVMRICTPVFLGFSITHAFHQEGKLMIHHRSWR
jgi:hypothetical protein